MLQKAVSRLFFCVKYKCETGVGAHLIPEFYEFYLGLGDPIAVSSVHGHGTGDLLDEVIKYFPEAADEERG